MKKNLLGSLAHLFWIALLACPLAHADTAAKPSQASAHSPTAGAINACEQLTDSELNTAVAGLHVFSKFPKGMPLPTCVYSLGSGKDEKEIAVLLFSSVPDEKQMFQQKIASGARPLPGVGTLATAETNHTGFTGSSVAISFFKNGVIGVVSLSVMPGQAIEERNRQAALLAKAAAAKMK